MLFTCFKAIFNGNHGSSRINRRELIWDSWNDGIYRDVSEEMLVNEAKAVKKYFPTVKWFELDDGYSAYDSGDVDSSSHGLGCVYEGEKAIEFSFASLGLNDDEYILTNVWTGEQKRCQNHYKVTLPVHGSELINVSKPCGVQILDANVEIKNAFSSAKEIEFIIPYAAQVNLLVLGAVKCVLRDGNEIDFYKDGVNLSFSIDKESTIKLIFN